MSEEDLKNIEQVKEILKIRKEQKEIIESAGGTCINCDPDIKALEGVLNLVKRLDNKYIREKVAKEEVEELLENSVPKEAIRRLLESEYNGIPIYRLDREHLAKNLKRLLEG